MNSKLHSIKRSIPNVLEDNPFEVTNYKKSKNNKAEKAVKENIEFAKFLIQKNKNFGNHSTNYTIAKESKYNKDLLLASKNTTKYNLKVTSIMKIKIVVTLYIIQLERMRREIHKTINI